LFDSIPATPIEKGNSSSNIINFESGVNTAIDLNSPQNNFTAISNIPQKMNKMGLISSKNSTIVAGGNLTNTTLIGVSKT